MGAPIMDAPAAPPSPARPNVFHKLFPKRGSRKANNNNNKKHSEPLKVASAMPPSSTTTTPPKKTHFWSRGSSSQSNGGGHHRNNATPPSRRNSTGQRDKGSSGTTPEAAREKQQQQSLNKNNNHKKQPLQCIDPILEKDNGSTSRNDSSSRDDQQHDQTTRTGDLSSHHTTSVLVPAGTGDATTSSSARDRYHQLEGDDDDDAEDESPETAALFLELSPSHHRDHGGAFGDGVAALELSVSGQKRLVKERDGFCRRVNRYDGSVIHVEGVASYELGNYLGGGVAGVVYEGQRLLPEAAYPVRRGKEQPTPEIMDKQHLQYGILPPSQSILDYVAVPNHLLCNGGGFGTSVIVDHHPLRPPMPPAGSTSLAPTGVISISPGDLAREGSMLTTESFANTAVTASRSVAGNSVALEAVMNDVILIDDQDAPSRSKQMAESLRQNSKTNTTGGGAVVNKSFQEAFMEEKVAIKILNPVGFRALATEVTGTAVVARAGRALSRDVRNGRRPMTEDHVWWLVNPSSRNLRTLQKYPDAASTPRGVEVDRGSADRGLRISLIAAFQDPKTNTLKELPLNRCIEIWGHIPFDTSDVEFRRIMQSIDKINQGLPPPALPPDRVATAKTTSMDDGSTVDNDVVVASPTKNTTGSSANFFKPPPSPMTTKRTCVSFFVVVDDVVFVEEHRFGLTHDDILHFLLVSTVAFSRPPRRPARRPTAPS
jgi:hypothetical protein